MPVTTGGKVRKHKPAHGGAPKRKSTKTVVKRKSKKRKSTKR